MCYTGGNVFNTPTVDTTILICNKNENERIILKNAIDFNSHKVNSVGADYFSAFGNIISVGGDAGSTGIFDKLFNKTFDSLETHFTVYQGIVTGNNTAFIFETEADAIEKGVDKKLLHPLCHGRDIEKYLVRNRERRILYIDDSVDIKKFPKTKRWLLNFKEQLDKRNEGKKDVISWCALHRPRVKSELDVKEKILLQNTRNESLKTRIVSTIDNESIYGTQGINFIIPKNGNTDSLQFLLGILNSKLMNYLFSTKFLNLAIKAEYVKQLRIPSVPKKEQKPIIELVEKILAAKKDNKNITDLEKQIDMLVYKLYDLTNEEIRVIEEK